MNVLSEKYIKKTYFKNTKIPIFRSKKKIKVNYIDYSDPQEL